MHKTERKPKDLSSFIDNNRISMTSSTKFQKNPSTNQTAAHHYTKTKRSEFKDIWERPLSSKLDLKIWMSNFRTDYNKKIGIGLGTKAKSVEGMFSFVAIDKDSIDWLINAINESIVIRNKNKESSFLNPIISKKHRIIDYLRKISITILVKRTDNNLSIILMLNSKPSLYTVLSDLDIDWIISTLELAKYNLSDANDNWKDNESPQLPNTTNVNDADKQKVPIKVIVGDKLSDSFFKDVEKEKVEAK